MKRTLITISVMVVVVGVGILLVGLLSQPAEPLELSLVHNLDESDYEGDGPTLTVRPETVYRNREVSVTASVFTGYRFVRWETTDGDLFSEEPTERFVITESMTLRAIYEPHEGEGQFYVSVSSNQDIVIDRAPEQPYPFYYTEGTQLNLIAPEIEGFRFDHYRDETTGELLTTNRIYTFIVNTDMHIKAVYAPEDYYYVLFTTNIDEAITFIVDEEPYDDIVPFEGDETIELEAPDIEGYGFVHWINRNGDVVSETRVFDYLVEGTEVLTAVYNEARLVYQTGFEDTEKMSYADGLITTQGRTWRLHEALIGSSHLDQHHDAQSVRLRGGFVESAFGVSELERIAFYASTFGDDEASTIHVQVSDDGEAWHTVKTIPVDDTLSYHETVLLEETLEAFNLNIDDVLYIRILHDPLEDGMRVNLDDLRLYVYQINDNFHD